MGPLQSGNSSKAIQRSSIISIFIIALALLVGFPSILLLAGCRSAEQEEPELTPAHRARMERGVDAMVASSVMQVPTTFRLTVLDPDRKPLSGVPVRFTVGGVTGRPSAVLQTGKGFFGSETYHVLTDASGLATKSVDRYVYVNVSLDLQAIGGRFVVPQENSADSTYPGGDGGQDRAWIAMGQQDKLHHSGTVTILPTVGPQALVKVASWRPGVRQVDAWCPVVAALAERGKLRGSDIAIYPPCVPGQEPIGLVVRGWRAEGKRRARPWLPIELDPETRQATAASQAARAAEACPWWLELTGVRGFGVVDASAEEWPFHAPEAGWHERLRFGSEDGSVTKVRARFWLRRPGTPVRYAFFDGEARLMRRDETNPNWGPPKSQGVDPVQWRGAKPPDPERDEIGLFGTLWINPSGSRNLERPLHFEQERYWRPAPQVLNGYKDWDQLLATWASESPEGYIKLQDDLPPAEDGKPASVPHGAPVPPRR